MKEPAELPGACVAIKIQGNLAGIDPIELDLEHRGGPPEVFDQRGNAGLGRHVSHPIAGQQLPRQGEDRQALHIFGALDVNRADAVQQVLARRPACARARRPACRTCSSAAISSATETAMFRLAHSRASSTRRPATGFVLPRSLVELRRRACRWRNRSGGRAARSRNASGSPAHRPGPP